MKIIILSLLLMVVLIQSATVHNPLIWADVPDIDVIRVEDTYYMISTTMFFNPGAPIMKSKNLVSWEICSYVYETLENGDAQNLNNGKSEYSHGQWAASLRYHEGIFYVFFCSFGSGHSYIFKTDDIENGKWEKITIGTTYHDASILFDDDGKKYLVYGVGELHIKEFNDDMTDFKRGGVDKVLLKTGISGLAGEGSHFYKIGNYYYVLVIAWPSGRRRIMVAYRSRELLGKYEGKEILDSPLGSYDAGVAQGAIFDTPDGKWYALLFQDHGSVGRVPCLVPCTWTDNWPILGVNGKAQLTFEMDVDTTTTVLADSDDFDYKSEAELSKLWQWNHNPDNKSWSVTERPGFLRLYNNNMASSIAMAKNTLTIRTEGPACNSYIVLDTSGMKPGDHAGLSAFQWNYGNVGVYVADNGQKKIYMSRNADLNKDSGQCVDKKVAETPLEGDVVYLKLDFKFSNILNDQSSSNNIDKVNFFYGYDGKEWTKIGVEIGMTYDLKWFIGYRSGIYSYPTKEKGGYADIDTFHYERTPWN